VFDIIAIFLKVDEKNDRDDCVTSRDSKMTNDNDSEDDDEARSREKSTKVAFRFFFFFFKNNTIEKKKTTKIVFRFFFSSSKVKIFEKKRTTKIVFRFFFFSERATSDDDIMTMIFVSINNHDDMNTFFVILTQSSFVNVAFSRTSLSEFFNR
jgi:hypothetical protein